MWLSLYIYHGDNLYGRDIDRLLALGIAPVVEQLRAEGRLERLFFVRYQDPHSHVRLRLEVRESDRSEIEEEVRAAVSTFLCSEGVNRPTRVERVDYIPELERYGGHLGMWVAEKHFALSSSIALEVLAETLDAGSETESQPATEARPQRFGPSLLLTLILARSFCRDFAAAASFLSGYAESYLCHILPDHYDREIFRRRLATEAVAVRREADRAVGALLEAARGTRGWGRPRLDRWSKGCFEIHREIRRLPDFPSATHRDASVVSASLLHMHHNRLGLSIPQEVQLAHLAADSLVRQEITS